MRNCIESILPGGEEVEIIIVDDGSKKDNTLEIAKEYEENIPAFARLFIRKTAVTVKRWTQALEMPADFILR